MVIGWQMPWITYNSKITHLNGDRFTNEFLAIDTLKEEAKNYESQSLCMFLFVWKHMI